jgi:hypothetical protein
MHSKTYERVSGVRPVDWRCGLCAAAWLLAGSAGLAAEPDPPPPNPAKPVNYVAWINEALGGDIKDNAYDAYLKAYEKITPFEGDWGETLKAPWSDNKAVSDWLAENRKGLSAFAKAARKRDCFFRLDLPEPTGDPRQDGWSLTVSLPYLGAHRTAARALIAAGYRDWAKGHRKTFPENALLVLRSAHHLDNQPMLIGRLVGLANAALGYQALRNALALSDERDKLAKRLLPELSHADPEPPPFSDAIRHEQWYAWDTCQRVFKPGPQPGTWALHEPTITALQNVGFPISRRDAGALAEIGYEATLSEITAYYGACAKWADMPFSQAKEQGARLRAMIDKSRNPLVKTLAVDLDRARVLHDRLTAERRATRLLVVIFAHHSQAGEYPETLGELDAGHLDEFRVDPFSGQDFIYHRQGESFTLYTVADNLEDDGGRHDPRWEGGDFVFWPKPD